MEVVLREYRPADADALRRCVVALQDFERTLEPRLRPGDAMAEAYCAQMHARCERAHGRVFVAEHQGAVVGFVTVLAREAFTELDEPIGTYAFVSDLVVLSRYRRRGIGRQLLARAEAFARDAGATEMRIGVLARNQAARHLYLSAGFEPHLDILAKRWPA